MLDLLSNALTAILGGGATGLLGSAVTGWLDYKHQAAKYKHDQRMEELSQQAIELENEGALAIADRKATAAEQVARSQAQTASYGADRATYAIGTHADNGWLIAVDVLRGIIRPLLTLYCAAILTMLLIYIEHTIGPGTQAELIGGILQQLVNGILYICSTVLLWWFGSRPRHSAKVHA